MRIFYSYYVNNHRIMTINKMTPHANPLRVLQKVFINSSIPKKRIAITAMRKSVLNILFNIHKNKY